MILDCFHKDGKRVVIRKKLFNSLVYVWKVKRLRDRALVGILVKGRNEGIDIDNVRFLRRAGGCNFWSEVYSEDISREIVSIVRKGNVIKGIVLLCYASGVSSALIQLMFLSFGLSEGKVVMIICNGEVRGYILKRMSTVKEKIEYEEVKVIKEGGNLWKRLFKFWKRYKKFQVV